MIPDGFEPKYLAALDEIYHSHWAARKKRRIIFLKEAVAHFWPEGHPTRLIHVTGTNGKGTVSHYLEQGLRFAGRTGSWTGPHVFDYAERFHIDGKPASHDEIVSVYREVLEPYQLIFMEQHPGESLSFAEQGILLSLHLFARHSVSWGVMEVGAGGRYTPLMALAMEACVLTNIGYDHPKTLGAELWQRALEKAGIARSGIPFFTSATGDAKCFVIKTAQAEGAPVFSVDGSDLRAVAPPDLPMPEHQRFNLALATRIIHYFYPDRSVAELAKTMVGRLPARFRLIAPNVLVDAAHNRDKISRFAEQLTQAYPNGKFRFLVGLTRSRNVLEVFAPLLPLARHILITSASYAGRDPNELARILKARFPAVAAEPDPRRAFELEKDRLQEGEMLVLTGSAYMIDQALNPNPYIRHTNASYGWRAAGQDEERYDPPGNPKPETNSRG